MGYSAGSETEPGWNQHMIHSTSPHSLTQSLDLLADTYNYNHWVYSLLRPFLGNYICEVGAGTGNLTRFLVNSRKLVCIEPEPIYAMALHELSAVHLNMTVCDSSLETFATQAARTDQVDSVVCVNVLEHIEEHADALRMMAGMLKDDGTILLFVPACSWAFGALDQALGHYRRYSKRSVNDVARQARLGIVRCHYVNFIGAFGWWWYSRIRGAVELDPKGVRLFDRFVPYVSAMERIVPPLVGQSLFVALKKE